MMLVQKQSPAHFSLAHRRHPSAPTAVVVQPTRTPGLLSLSKPVSLNNAQQRVIKPSPKKPAVVAKDVPKAETDRPTPNRGRPQKQNRDKAQSAARSASRSSSKRINRQPSPPSSSQAEDSHKQPQAKPVPIRPAPQLTSRPTGKLARRRQRDQQTYPASVPNPSTVKLSRSVPDVFPICDDMTEIGDGEFSDREDDIRKVKKEQDDEFVLHLPTTPTRASRKPNAATQVMRFPISSTLYDDGPKTAPLSSSSGYPPRIPGVFPFPSRQSPQSSPQKKGRQSRKHKRSPSEGVFLMSSSEDSDSNATAKPSSYGTRSKGPSNPKRHSTAELKALFGLSATPSPSSSVQQKRVSAVSLNGLTSRAVPVTAGGEAEEAEGYFAGSLFQNSPSPEDLPPPAF